MFYRKYLSHHIVSGPKYLDQIKIKVNLSCPNPCPKFCNFRFPRNYGNFWISKCNHRSSSIKRPFLLHEKNCIVTKPTKWHVRPAKTQISLDIRPVWSKSSLSAWRKLGSLATHWEQSEDSDQTGRMPRLIWVFAGRTCHFVGFVTMRLKRHHTYIPATICSNFDVNCNYIGIHGEDISKVKVL